MKKEILILLICISNTLFGQLEGFHNSINIQSGMLLFFDPPKPRQNINHSPNTYIGLNAEFLNQKNKGFYAMLTYGQQTTFESSRYLVVNSGQSKFPVYYPEEVFNKKTIKALHIGGLVFFGSSNDSLNPAKKKNNNHLSFRLYQVNKVKV